MCGAPFLDNLFALTEVVFSKRQLFTEETAIHGHDDVGLKPHVCDPITLLFGCPLLTALFYRVAF
jgi:hypothetical protein